MYNVYKCKLCYNIIIWFIFLTIHFQHSYSIIREIFFFFFKREVSAKYKRIFYNNTKVRHELLLLLVCKPEMAKHKMEVSNEYTYKITSEKGGKNIEIYILCQATLRYADNPISVWRVYIQDSPKLSSILLYTEP